MELDKQQERAIERFVKAYENLHKVGLEFYLYESNGYICKLKDFPDGTIDSSTEEDINDLYIDGKSINLLIEIENFNA